MTELNQDFTIYQQESVLVTISVTEGGNEKNITGADIEWVLYTVSGSTETVLITKTVGSGIIITDGSVGDFQVSLSSSDTGALAVGEYYHQAELYVGGVRKIVCEGTVTVKRNATS